MEDKLGGSRNIAIGMGAACLAALALLFLLLRPADAQAIQQTGGGANYVGVATCAGTTCHGRSHGDGPRVRQDELMLWQDPATAAGAHSRAYGVLREARSRAIAQRLGLGEASGEPMCLGCHATPGGARGVRFQTGDGVGCESCHGPAGGWLSSHYTVGGSHRANLNNGLRELDNPVVRAETCLNCHYGSRERGQFVNHQIMAAGHPRISFELDLFSTLQQHYTIDRDYRERGKRVPDGTQVWAIGQAMALQRSLDLFRRPTRGVEGIFPEFYFFDCHSCHRQISDDPRYRPGAAANPGRPIPAGMPPYNDENMIMLSAAARQIAPTLAARFDRESREFHLAMATGRAAAVREAERLDSTLELLVRAFSTATITADTTFAIIDRITTDAIRDRFTDYAGSVQAVMATDTLLSSLVSRDRVSVSAANAIRVDINSAYRAVRDPNAYDPGGFRASLGRAAAAIRRLR